MPTYETEGTSPLLLAWIGIGSIHVLWIHLNDGKVYEACVNKRAWYFYETQHKCTVKRV